MGISEKIKILETIAKDMENDAREFDGKPFNGKTVAEYFGNHGAAIAALADFTISAMESVKELESSLLIIEQMNDKKYGRK